MKIIGLAGWSGAGKTTLLNKLIPHLIGLGVSVSTIKHAHHGFDVDIPGKDSWQHRHAGATEVLVASGKRWALMRELRGETEWSLLDLLDKLTPVDLVIVEGFRRSGHPKIEVHRAENAKSYLWPDDRDIVGIAADAPAAPGAPPCVALDAIAAIADMMLAEAQPIDTVRARLAQQRD
jgi:molybdopterin-guanine dinucleotide biosynthesis protein B